MYKAPKINFIGGCTVIPESDGSITVRVGPNLNHSQFGKEDGHSDYTSIKVNSLTISDPNGSNTSNMLNSNGTEVTYNTSKEITFDINTKSEDGLMHFDKTSGFAFVLEVANNDIDGDTTDDQISYMLAEVDMGTVGATAVTSSFTAYKATYNNATKTYTKSADNFTNTKLTVRNFRTEEKTGATGYQGAIEFNVKATDIIGIVSTTAPTNDISKYEIKSLTLANETETANTFKAETKLTCAASRSYWWNSTDNQITPGITALSATIDISSMKTIQFSGITYYNGSNLPTCKIYYAGISNLYKPYGIKTNFKVVSSPQFFADHTDTLNNTITERCTSCNI